MQWKLIVLQFSVIKNHIFLVQKNLKKYLGNSTLGVHNPIHSEASPKLCDMTSTEAKHRFGKGDRW